MQEFSEIAKPYGSSHCINLVDNERYPERIRNCFTETNWLRLGECENKSVLDNRFFTYLGYQSSTERVKR